MAGAGAAADVPDGVRVRRRTRLAYFVTTLAAIALSWPPRWFAWLGFGAFLLASWPGRSLDPPTTRGPVRGARPSRNTSPDHD